LHAGIIKDIKQRIQAPVLTNFVEIHPFWIALYHTFTLFVLLFHCWLTEVLHSTKIYAPDMIGKTFVMLQTFFFVVMTSQLIHDENHESKFVMTVPISKDAFRIFICFFLAYFTLFSLKVTFRFYVDLHLRPILKNAVYLNWLHIFFCWLVLTFNDNSEQCTLIVSILSIMKYCSNIYLKGRKYFTSDKTILIQRLSLYNRLNVMLTVSLGEFFSRLAQKEWAKRIQEIDGLINCGIICSIVFMIWWTYADAGEYFDLNTKKRGCLYGIRYISITIHFTLILFSGSVGSYPLKHYSLWLFLFGYVTLLMLFRIHNNLVFKMIIEKYEDISQQAKNREFYNNAITLIVTVVVVAFEANSSNPNEVCTKFEEFLLFSTMLVGSSLILVFHIRHYYLVQMELLRMKRMNILIKTWNKEKIP